MLEQRHAEIKLQKSFEKSFPFISGLERKFYRCSLISLHGGSRIFRLSNKPLKAKALNHFRISLDCITSISCLLPVCNACTMCTICPSAGLLSCAPSAHPQAFHLPHAVPRSWRMMGTAEATQKTRPIPR